MKSPCYCIMAPSAVQKLKALSLKMSAKHLGFQMIPANVLYIRRRRFCIHIFCLGEHNVKLQGKKTRCTWKTTESTEVRR